MAPPTYHHLSIFHDGPVLRRDERGEFLGRYRVDDLPARFARATVDQPHDETASAEDRAAARAVCRIRVDLQHTRCPLAHRARIQRRLGYELVSLALHRRGVAEGIADRDD